MGELAKAVSKFMRAKERTDYLSDNVIEKIADVYIATEQILVIIGADHDELSEKIAFKSSVLKEKLGLE